MEARRRGEGGEGKFWKRRARGRGRRGPLSAEAWLPLQHLLGVMSVKSR